MKIVSLAIASIMMLANSAGTLAAIPASANHPVRIAVTEEVRVPDIFHLSELNTTDQWALTMIGDRLLYLNQNGELVPDLAKDWEIIFCGVTTEHIDIPFSPYDIELDGPISDWDSYPPGMDPNFDPSNINGFDVEVGYAYLHFTLSEDALFSDGESLTSSRIEEIIENAKASDPSSVAYKQWAAVTQFINITDYEFELYLDFEGLPYGFMDFVYSLASPSGTIIEPYYPDELLGTGAYVMEIDPQADYIAHFTRNENWKGNPVAMREHDVSNTNELEEEIIFQYSEMEAALADLLSGAFQIAPITKERYYSEIFERYPDNKAYFMSHDPILLEYNVSHEPLNSFSFRKLLFSCFYTYSTSNDVFYKYLNGSSNDFWEATYYQDTYMDIYDQPLHLKLLYQDDPLCFQLAKFVKGLIEDNRYSDMVQVSIDTFQDLEESKNRGKYDFILYKVDLDNINSAYNTLYPISLGNSEDCQELTEIEANLNTLLEMAQNSINPESYGKMEYTLQYCLLRWALYLNLGWEPLVFITSPNLCRFITPKGFCPTGDVPRIDFRWIKDDME